MISRFFKTTGIILMYHRVADIKPDPWGLCVSPDNFQEHMRLVEKLGEPVACRALIKSPFRLGGKRHNIGITFDDGYADNYHQAAPVLKRHNIPATFFVVSHMIDSRQEFWWDHLERLIMHTQILPDSIALNVKGTTHQWGTTAFHSGDLYRKIWTVISGLSPHERQTALDQIETQVTNAEPACGDNRTMSSDELRCLACDPLFEIGSHSATHPMMGDLTQEEQQQEITSSKQLIKEKTGVPVTSFSCPHGSFNEWTKPLLIKLGFEAMYTSRDANVRSNRETWELPRRVVGTKKGFPRPQARYT